MWWGDSLFDARPLTVLAIGVAAFVDVVLRSILLGSGVQVEIVAALVSLTTFALGHTGLELAVWMADWVFLTAFVFGITPYVFPPRMRGTVQSLRVRAGATATVVGVGLVLQAGLWTISPEEARVILQSSPLTGIGSFWLWLLVWLSIGLLLTAVAARSTAGDAILTSSTATLLDAWTPFREVRGVGPWRLVLAGGLVGLVFLLLGLFTIFVASLSPLPETLVLVWGMTVAVTRRRGRPVTFLNRTPPDVESRFALPIAAVTAGPKGTVCGLLLLVGTLPFLMLAGPMALFILAIVVGTPLVLITEGLMANLVYLDSLYLTSAGVLSGGYALWYFSRLLERLPRFLQAWTVVSPRDRITLREWPDHQQLVTRPPGLMIPPMLVILVMFIGMTYTGNSRGHGVVAVPIPYLVAATGALGLVGASVLRARRRPPQPPLSDGYALPAAVTVVVTVLLFMILERTASARELVGAVVSLSSPPVGALTDLVTIALGVGFILGFIFTVPDVWEQRYRGAGYRLVPGGYVLTIGVVTALILPYPWSIFPGIVALVGALVLVVEGTRLLPFGGLYRDAGARGTLVWLLYLGGAAVTATAAAYELPLPSSARMVLFYLGVFLGIVIVVYPSYLVARELFFRLL